MCPRPLFLPKFANAGPSSGAPFCLFPPLANSYRCFQTLIKSYLGVPLEHYELHLCVLTKPGTEAKSLSSYGSLIWVCVSMQTLGYPSETRLQVWLRVYSLYDPHQPINLL